MRIWSLHPRHLDRIGLVACWRETLLAQAVLAGRTKGYRNHPQLDRFRETPEPLEAVGSYLHGLADEADRRGYRFDRTRVDTDGGSAPRLAGSMSVSEGQLDLEWHHLGAKLAERSPEDAVRWREAQRPSAHEIFVVVPGDIASWERAALPNT